MHVHRDLEVLAHRPQPVVLGVVERLHPRRVGRDVRQEHPPRRPCSLIHVASSMASSMSLRKIWPMPARRSGNSCRSRRASGCAPGCRRGGARSPRASAARRTARSSGRTAARCSGRSPRRRRRRPPGRRCAARCPSCGARSVSRRSFHGFLYLPRHASKSSWNLGSRYSRYVGVAPAGVAVGRDDRVAVLGLERGHGVLPRPGRTARQPGQSAVEHVLAPPSLTARWAPPPPAVREPARAACSS